MKRLGALPIDSYVGSLVTNFRHLSFPSASNPARTNLFPSDILPTDDDPQLREQIHWRYIPDGRPGTVATLETMTGLAQDAAADIDFQAFIKQCHNWQELLQWTRAHYFYREERNEVVRDPRRMLGAMGQPDGSGRLQLLEGDCDDVATFLAAGLKVLGYPVRFFALRASPDRNDFEHVVTQALDRLVWVTLDPTVPAGTVMTVRDQMIRAV